MYKSYSLCMESNTYALTKLELITQHSNIMFALFIVKILYLFVKQKMGCTGSN